MEVDWTELPAELIEAISKKLKFYSDYIRFQRVCRNWRLSIPKTPNHLPPQLPWLMLPQSQSQSQSQTHCAFFNLSANKVHLLNLPEASLRSRHCGSSHGWVIILDETPAILLLNPLTRVKIYLPPLSSFPNVVSFSYFDIGREYTVASYLLAGAGDRYNCSLRQMRDSFIKKIVLSSSPVDKDYNFFAVAILNQAVDLAYCRNGDQCWTLIEGMQSYSEDVIYRKGSFYAVDKAGLITVCDVAGDKDKPRVSIIQTPPQFGGDMQYLVGSEDELLLVTRYLDLEFDFEPHQPQLVYRTTRFEVFKLNWCGPQWERMRSLGDTALFIGQNSSLALSASDFPGCLADCIYYTDDYSESNYDDVYGEHDLGIFKLEDGSIEPLPCYPRYSHYRLRWPPALWVTPNPC